MADPAPPGSARYVAMAKDCLGVAPEALLVAAFLLDIQHPSRPWGAAAWAKVKR